jgi:hypothetical protein
VGHQVNGLVLAILIAIVRRSLHEKGWDLRHMLPQHFSRSKTGCGYGTKTGPYVVWAADSIWSKFLDDRIVRTGVNSWMLSRLHIPDDRVRWHH